MISMPKHTITDLHQMQSLPLSAKIQMTQRRIEEFVDRFGEDGVYVCHLEKPDDARFVKLKETHPGMYKLLDIIKNNGITYRQAIDWINEHGNMNIKY